MCVKIITVKEAVAKMKSAGITQMNEQRLRAGIQQRVYPFGVAVHLTDWVFEIYDVKLEQWLKERAN